MVGAGAAGPRRRRPGGGRPRPARRCIRAVAVCAVVALCALTLGALVPALPGVGVVGTYLMGLYAVPLLCGSVVLLGALAVPAVRRAGVAERLALGAAALTVCAQGMVVSCGARAAHRAGADVSWWQAAVSLGQPDVHPDSTVAFASGGGRDLLVDVYLPPARQARAGPAVVWAHGGGFTGGRRTDRRGTFRWLARHGYAVFSADYRLAATGRPGWDRQPQDLVCAVAWVRAHARRFGVDPGRVALGGESAGGTLALDVAYRLAEGSVTARAPGRGDCGPAPPPPAAVAAFYPAVDLAQAWRRDLWGSRSNVRALLGGPPGRFPARYRALSPTAHLSARVPATLLVVGSHDHLVGTAQSVGLHRRLRALGVPSSLTLVPFSDHAFDLAFGSVGAQTGRSALLAFLRERVPADR